MTTETWILTEEVDSMQRRNEFEELIEHIRYQVEEARVNQYIQKAVSNMGEQNDLKEIIRTIADASQGEDFVIRITIDING